METNQKPPSRSSFSSPRASKRFVIAMIALSLVLAFLAAMSIKMATENTAFQEEVQKMRELHDPAFRPPSPADSSSMPADTSRQSRSL